MKPTHNSTTRQGAYLPDLAGNSWTWNCGWRIVDQKGNLRDMPALGHAKFRKSITLATREDINARIGPRKRPEGMWRRVLPVPYVHNHTGQVGRVLATDGVHSIFVTNNADGDKVKLEVMFNNLSEAKPSKAPAAKHRKVKTKTKTKTTTTSLAAQTLINSFFQ
jgi:hypothetical protein